MWATFLRVARPRSILARITLLYALVSAVLLIASAAVLYWMLQQNLRRQDNGTVVEEVHVLRSILEGSPRHADVLTQEVRGEGGSDETEKIFDRVLAPSGKILIQTQGMKQIAPVAIFPRPEAADAPLPEVAHRLRLPHDRIVRLMSAWVRLPGPPPRRRLIQVALDVTHDERALRAYRATLFMVVIAGLLLSVVAALLISRKVMAPLREITESVQNIGVDQLHARIETTTLPLELRSLADNFNGMLTRLEDAFARLSQFSADLAHELRTPINNLMGEAEVTLARPRPGPEYRQVLESSLEELGRLARMIDSLLFLARAAHGALPLSAVLLDAAVEAQAVCEFHEAVADEHAVVLRIAGHATAYADPLLLRRALNNLISNALRYTSPGGLIEIQVTSTAGGVEWCVRDTGCGVDERHIPHLFDRFYRADDARSEHGAGFGLGLAIVRSIAEVHRGHVRIASVPGVGTEVRLWLPGFNLV